MNPNLAAHYLDEARRQMRGHKRMAEGAMAQLQDEDFFVALDPESNSVAMLVKHLAGNMRSRFTDFLTTDGEKPDRFRDQEFEVTPTTTRAEVMKWWEEGWTLCSPAIDGLKLRRRDAHRDDSRRAAHRAAGYQPADRALCRACRADRVSGEASAVERMEDAEHSAREVGRVQEGNAEAPASRD